MQEPQQKPAYQNDDIVIRDVGHGMILLIASNNIRTGMYTQSDIDLIADAMPDEQKRATFRQIMAQRMARRAQAEAEIDQAIAEMNALFEEDRGSGHSA